jgi:putative SOS response-associated peptidase YedK
MVNLEGKEEKYPFNFFLKDRKLFGFAGIYNEFEGPDGKPLLTCAIITTKPNERVARVHNRMPVIIKEEDEDSWLDPENKNSEKLLTLLAPYPADQMGERIVSKRVNNPRFNDEKLIDEFKVKGRVTI